MGVDLACREELASVAERLVPCSHKLFDVVQPPLNCPGQERQTGKDKHQAQSHQGQVQRARPGPGAVQG